jgi:DNA repair exonuclease SbcCD ATPase subunit
MIFEQIPSTVSEFTHIIHVADIHIRLTKRHQEYREVFERLYAEVKASPPTTVVCVLGDVCHSKSDLSPECVQMISDLLSNLANLRETVLVPGNHDATLANKTRLDSLSPIVDALNHPKLHYFKETKLYGFGNILFNNMCIFDDPEKYTTGQNIPEIYRNQYKHVVALFHGAVDRSVTDTGFAISNPSIMPPLFDWHDIALLGDIHRRQNLQEAREEEHKPCIHYPGSLIQQNHGESLHPHGYTMWNLSDYTYQYKEVPNDYGYYTIDIHGAKILTDLTDIPKKTYLRVKCLDSIPTEVKAAEALIGTLTEIHEIARIRLESERDKKAKDAEVCKDVKLADIADEDYQSKLIEEFLRTKLNFDDEAKIKKIVLINRIVNHDVKRDEFARNLKWIPLRFEWDNMFAYGEDNYIDFTQMNGVYGVFGPNTCGKSSIFAALCFCLFDKWDRGFKAVVARNSQKQGFRCKLEFSIAGIHYFIEKIGESTKSGNVKVKVNFWKMVGGEMVDLTDVMRRDTNEIIREYVGSFEDFVLTSLSVQHATKNNISFIDMGNTERKDLLVQLMGLNIFDRLHDVAHEKSKDLMAKIKPHKEKNYMRELDETEVSLTKTEKQIDFVQVEITEYSKQIKDVNDSIVAETSKLIKLDSDIPTDLAELNRRRESAQRLLEGKNKKLSDDKTELVSRKATLDRLSEELSEIIAEDLVKAHATYNDFRKNLEMSQREFDLKMVSVAHNLEKLEALRKKYNYDPKCKFCVQNVEEKDSSAKKVADNLQKELAEREKAALSISSIKEKIKEWDWVDVAYQNYTKLLNEHSKFKDLFTTLNTQILLAEKDVEKITGTAKELDAKIQIYHRNQVALENNQKVNMVILTYKNALNKVESSLHTSNKNLNTLTGQKEVLKKRIEDITETITDLIATEEERELYEYYCKCVGRNGIPYRVIRNVIPQITREVNSILSQLSEFTIEFDADEKNIIPYVNYESKGKWPIEMTSGFERFVSSVAIRVALANISNLPRTNFLILDEGFGALDGHNLVSMHTLFTYLKSHFDIVMIISHLDSMKDMVDKRIEIVQSNNFSLVTFE